MLIFQRTANALRALSRMGSLGGLMAGGGKSGAAAGSAAAPKPGGFLKKVKEEKAKEEAQETATKPEPKKEPVRIFKEDPRKTTGDNLTPAGPLGPSLSGRRSPALSGRRSPVSRAEARKYSTPESTTPSTRASTWLNVLVHLSNQCITLTKWKCFRSVSYREFQWVFNSLFSIPSVLITDLCISSV